MDSNSQGSKYRAAIGCRSESRGGAIVHTLATTSNKAVAVEGRKIALLTAYDAALAAYAAAVRGDSFPGPEHCF
jgi:ketopantoate hydroxymethyltransferase